MASVMSAGSSLAPIQRLFDREDYKQALKEARVAHRKAPTDESRLLLTRCCLARTDELLKRSLTDEARKLLDELTTLRPLAEDLKAGLPELLVRAGAYDRYAAPFGLQSAEAGELSPALADAAILSGATVPGAGNRAEAEAIRKAMAALDANDDAALAAALEPVSRNSPFADWKLFLRGAAAYFRGDDEAMRANWKRLDPARKAVKIADRLNATVNVAGSPTFPASPADLNSLAMVERAAFGGEALSHLRNLKELLEGDDQRRVLAALRAAVTVLGERSPRLRDRLIELIVQRAIDKIDRELLDNLARATSSPAADPKWNRAWALLWEDCDELVGGESTDELARKHWLALIDDLDHSSAFSEPDRKIAQALVMARVARTVASWVDEDEERLTTMNPYEWDLDFTRAMITRNRAQVLDLLARARKLAPGVRAVWETHFKVCELWRDDEGGIAVLTEQIKHFPDDYALLRKVGAAHLYFKDDPTKALECFEKARRLKPLDESLLEWLWQAHTIAARRAALDHDFAAARDHLVKAEQCDPQQEKRLLLLGQRSILERKAGQDDEAMRLDAEARALLQEPTAALLVLATEAARHKLSKTLVKAYRDDWEKLLKKKCASETAGLMALTMRGLIKCRVEYEGFDKHLQAVSDYIARTTKVKYERRHLVAVCEFYLGLDRHLSRQLKGGVGKILGNMATRGTKLFPEDPFFWTARGDAQLALKPHSPWTAERYFEKALELAEANPQSASPEMINHIRDMLERLEFHGPGFNFPFPDPRRPDSTPVDSDDDEFDLDDDRFDDEGDMPAPRRSNPRRAGARRASGPVIGANPEVKYQIDLANMPPDIRKMVEAMAALAGRSIEDVVAEAVAQIENEERPPKGSS